MPYIDGGCRSLCTPTLNDDNVFAKLLKGLFNRWSYIYVQAERKRVRR